MRALVGLWILLGVFAATARAATVVALDEAQLTRRADAVVFGTVLDHTTETLPDGVVVSRAHLQVYRALSGAAPGELLLVQVPGGVLPSGLVARSFGAPMLSVGQMAVAFLERHGDHFRPLGLSYGWLPVRRDAKGTLRVSRHLDGLGLVGPNGESIADTIVRIDAVELESFLGRIARHVPDLSPLPFAGPGGVSR